MPAKKRVLDTGFMLALGAAAFVFCRACGARGFFPLDQSIVFDGAWRVSLGQVPFRDFVAPIGPISFFYQAFLFRLFGVGFNAYILGGAILNGLAAMMVFAIVRMTGGADGTDEGWNLAKASGAGCATAVWFQAQMGTTYPDQVAMFLCLVSMFFIVLSGKSEAEKEDADPNSLFRRCAVLMTVAGLSWGMAFAAKQNYAAFFVPVLAAAIYLNPRGKMDAVWFAAGAAAFTAFSLVWLFIFSDLWLFWKYFIEIPVGEGIRRFVGENISTGFRHRIPLDVAIPLSVVLALALWTIIAAWKKRGCTKLRGDIKTHAAVLVCFLAAYSFVMMMTTNNNSENTWSLIGLVLGIGFVWPDDAGKTLARGRYPVATILRCVAVAMFAINILGGANSAWKRQAQDMIPPLKFHPVSFPSTVAPLQWCDTTPIGTVGGRTVVVPTKHFELLCRIVANHAGNVFIFPDFTAIYGLTGKHPPQPLLWFHDGLTFAKGGDPELDAWIVGALEKNQVDMIVLEEVSWLGSYITLKRFPLLDKYISTRFQKVGRIGAYQIRTRRPILEKSPQ